MSDTTKQFSQRDPGQTLQASFNDSDSTLSVNGFLVGKVGRRIDVTITTTTIANDTENYAFSETLPSPIALYTLKIVYTDGSRTQILYCLRTA